MDLWITGAGLWFSAWTDITAHTLTHSLAGKPVTHKLHSYYDYYPLPLNENNSKLKKAAQTVCKSYF